MSKRRYEVKATTYDRRGRVIARGFNSYQRTHPRQKELAERSGNSLKPFLHAEIHAILRSRRSEIYKIVVERYDSEGNPKMAKPCAICEIAIREAGIARVEYTTGHEI